MVRIAKQTDPKKLEELKNKVNDPRYLQVAIKRIAAQLTDEILYMSSEEKHGYK